jgi:hypothetical protein
MRKLVLSLACLTALGFAGGAMAQPPHGKATILHCGCVLDADNVVGMAYVQVSVSSKARGHLNHAADSLDSCVTADGDLVDFMRTGSDCQLDGAPLGDLQGCVEQVANASCGVEVVQQ